MTASAGGTFCGGTWGWPYEAPQFTAAPRDPELERAAAERALQAEHERDLLARKSAPAEQTLAILLELVRAELVKLRLTLEKAMAPRHDGDTTLEDIQRHWNVAAR